MNGREIGRLQDLSFDRPCGGGPHRTGVDGLTGSTLITPVLIPVVYSLFHPDRNVEA